MFLRKNMFKRGMFPNKKERLNRSYFFNLSIDEQQLVGMEFQYHFHQGVL